MFRWFCGFGRRQERALGGGPVADGAGEGPGRGLGLRMQGVSGLRGFRGFRGQGGFGGFRGFGV